MPTNAELLDGVMKSITDLSADVKKLKDGNGGSKEAIEKQMADIMTKREQALRDKLISEFRKGSYSDLPSTDEERDEAAKSHELIIGKAQNEKQRELQKFNDRVLLCSKILKVHPTRLKMWGKDAVGGISELKKAMDSATTSEGLEWVPTNFSADLNDRVRLAFKVAALHRHLPMPTNPFKLPVVGSDATANLIPESTADGTDTKIAASTPGTRAATLTAKKFAARVLYSEELSEDSIIAVSEFVFDNIAIAMADAMEDAIINGSTAANHLDSDVTASTDRRKAFDGYRKAVLASKKTDLSSTNFTTANLRVMRAGMGKYGVDPSKLAIVTGPVGYSKLLGLTEVLTLEKYGPSATILTGELAKFDGIPIIVSGKIREDLSTTGAYDGTTTTKSILLMVYVPQFIIGDRRKITLKTWEDIERDQTVVVATSRNAFTGLFDSSTEPIVALGHNIA